MVANKSKHIRIMGKEILANSSKPVQWIFGTHVGRMITSMVLGVLFLLIHDLSFDYIYGLKIVYDEKWNNIISNSFYYISLLLFGLSALNLLYVLVMIPVGFLKRNGWKINKNLFKN